MRITISGVPGSGKTVVSKALAEKLKLEYYSMGIILRELAKKKNLTILEITKLAEKDDTIDKELDNLQKQLNKKDNFVIDSRLGFYFIPDSIKIFLTCDDETAARRIYRDQRDDEKYINYSDALKQVKTRRESEKKRYLKYYNIDYTDPKYFDLIIDTSDYTTEETVNIILTYLNNLIKQQPTQKSKNQKN